MASELQVDKLTGNTTANDITVTVWASVTMSLEQGLAKSWVSSNGTGTIAVRGSFNVSSISDVTTGKILVTVTNGFDSMDNMSTSGGAANGVGSGSTYVAASFIGSTTTYRTHGIWGTSHYDIAYVLGQVHGDLA